MQRYVFLTLEGGVVNASGLEEVLCFAEVEDFGACEGVREK
jgi:hypothetical protein